ncbi:preprotein translocase subunit SecE [Tessaracoccus sp. G1721]
MSDKSHDEPDNEEIVSDEPATTDADEIVSDEEALAEAEAEAMAADEDVTLEPAPSDDDVISEHEREFTEDELTAAATPAIQRRTAKAPVRKAAPTRKRNASVTEAEDPYRAGNPAEFVRQSAGELKKVVWPTWPQLVTMFGAVLVFVLIMIFIVGVLDLAFGWFLLQIFGSNT